MIAISCKKDNFNYPEGKVGISKITYYIDIAPKGAALKVINKGDTYTDEGAISTAGGKDAPYKPSGTVNSAVPGIYVIDYAATNEDGFSSSAYRTVVVMDPAATTKDLSGTYTRSTNGRASVWTKTAPGVYSVTNPGGAAVPPISVVVVNYSGNNIAIPQQETSAGTFSSSNGIYNPAGPSYSWNIANGGYGQQSRTFNKQP